MEPAAGYSLTAVGPVGQTTGFDPRFRIEGQPLARDLSLVVDEIGNGDTLTLRANLPACEPESMTVQARCLPILLSLPLVGSVLTFDRTSSSDLLSGLDKDRRDRGRRGQRWRPRSRRTDQDLARINRSILEGINRPPLFSSTAHHPARASPKSELSCPAGFPYLSIARGGRFLSSAFQATYDEADDASYKLGLSTPSRPRRRRREPREVESHSAPTRRVFPFRHHSHPGQTMRVANPVNRNSSTTYAFSQRELSPPQTRPHLASPAFPGEWRNRHPYCRTVAPIR